MLSISMIPLMLITLLQSYMPRFLSAIRSLYPNIVPCRYVFYVINLSLQFLLNSSNPLSVNEHELLNLEFRCLDSKKTWDFIINKLSKLSNKQGIKGIRSKIRPGKRIKGAASGATMTNCRWEVNPGKSNILFLCDEEWPKSYLKPDFHRFLWDQDERGYSFLAKGKPQKGNYFC